jgi:hypothetical protein
MMSEQKNIKYIYIYIKFKKERFREEKNAHMTTISSFLLIYRIGSLQSYSKLKFLVLQEF